MPQHAWTCCVVNLCYSSFVETAYVCGIDAEWEPGLATASATLLQLAFATCQQHKQGSTVLLLVSCSGCKTMSSHLLDFTSSSTHLQDLIALPQAAVKDFLQSLLRNASILKVRFVLQDAQTTCSKPLLQESLQFTLCSNTCRMLWQVGYGLAHDLWAIAAALGDEGLGCVSVVQPQLDVGTLHRQLHKAHVPGIRKVPAMPSHNLYPACIQLGTQGMYPKDQGNVGHVGALAWRKLRETASRVCIPPCCCNDCTETCLWVLCVSQPAEVCDCVHVYTAASCSCCLTLDTLCSSGQEGHRYAAGSGKGAVCFD